MSFLSDFFVHLNASVLLAVFCANFAVCFLLKKQLENLHTLSDLTFSKPPAPLNACVIRGVFFCPSYKAEWTVGGISL